MGVVKVIAKEIKQEILGKVKSGEGVMDLSRQYGISDKTILWWTPLSTQ